MYQLYKEGRQPRHLKDITNQFLRLEPALLQFLSLDILPQTDLEVPTRILFHQQLMKGLA